jgi:hypothetical protein
MPPSNKPEKMESPAMFLMTQAGFLELVEELRVMAMAAPTAKVQDGLTRMADRYAAPVAYACVASAVPERRSSIEIGPGA